MDMTSRNIPLINSNPL